MKLGGQRRNTGAHDRGRDPSDGHAVDVRFHRAAVNVGHWEAFLAGSCDCANVPFSQLLWK